MQHILHNENIAQKLDTQLMKLLYTNFRHTSRNAYNIELVFNNYRDYSVAERYKEAPSVEYVVEYDEYTKHATSTSITAHLASTLRINNLECIERPMVSNSYEWTYKDDKQCKHTLRLTRTCTGVKTNIDKWRLSDITL